MTFLFVEDLVLERVHMELALLAVAGVYVVPFLTFLTFFTDLAVVGEV